MTRPSATVVELLSALVASDASRFALVDADGWRRLALEARRVHASPALYSAIARCKPSPGPPANLASELRAVHAACTASNLELEHEMQRVLDRFGRAGVRALPLKGTALFALGVYRDIGARPTLDLDLLTNRRDRRGVLRLLRELGYEWSGVGGWPKHLPGMERGRFVVEVHEIAYWAPDGRRFGVGELAAPDGRPRLDRTMAHLLHHLCVSSVQSPPLAIKTLLDFDAALARFSATERDAIRRACDEIGLGAELARLSAALDWLRSGGGLEPPPDAARFVAACDAGVYDRERAELRYLYRSILRAPLWIAAGTLRALLFPSRRTLEAIEGLPRGSPRVCAAYARRPVVMAARGIRAAWRAIR